MSAEVQCNCLAERLEPILAQYDGREGVLVPLLQDVQDELGYLPEGAVDLVSERLHMSPAQVYGVASFYSQFYFEPRGRNIVKVCVGTACHIRGATAGLEWLEEELGIADGETSEDMEFTLETVNCVGCCGLAPVIVVNDRVVRKKDQEKAVAQIMSRGGD